MKKKTKEQEEYEQRKREKDRPPDGFCEWWNPTAIDRESGASIGGHPDAERVVSRKDPGRWTRRTYGINAVTAWLAQPYRDEYYRWVDAGRPESEPFLSIQATLGRQKEFFAGLKATIRAIGKPVPRLSPKERQAEARRMSQPTKLIEPIDEV